MKYKNIFALSNISRHGELDVQAPVSISDKTSYRKISWNIEAVVLVV